MDNYGLNKNYKVVCHYITEKQEYLIVETKRVPNRYGRDEVEYALYTFDGKKAQERLGKASSPTELEKKYILKQKNLKNN
jgi:hypothetical protein